MVTRPAIPLPVISPDDSLTAGGPALRAHFSLIRVFALMERRLARVMARFGLTLAHFEVLIWIAEAPGLTQRELTERLLVTKGNVCITLDKMEAAGLVERRPDPDDRRANRLFLTAKGRATLLKVLPIHHGLIATAMAVLSPAEQVSLHRMLDRLESAHQAALESPCETALSIPHGPAA